MDKQESYGDLECFTYKFSDTDYIILSRHGGRIIKLVLNNTLIIEGHQPLLDLGSGSYLMYPWVSKIEKQQPQYKFVFTDAVGRPVHGVVVNAPNILNEQRFEDNVRITSRPSPLTPPELPDFVQTFTLSKGKLTISLKVIGQSSLPLCFGYHPYFQIDKASLKDLVILTNIKRNLKLDEKTLLPVSPFVQTDMQINSQTKYDNLFKHTAEEKAYFHLIEKKSNKKVSIESQNMKYWQVYTPQDGKRIAIQPMTFIGNIYNIYKEQIHGVLPRQGSFSISCSTV